MDARDPNRFDATDRKILRLLQVDAGLTAASIAQKVDLSVAACSRRIKHLRDSKVIVREVALIDPKAVGNYLTIVIQVTLERERVDLLEGFKKAMNAAPEVAQCYMVSGEADFTLIVLVKDMDEYNTFVQETFYGDNNVKKFSTMFVMQRVKFTTAVPI
jgi:Lrp/AsnC family transcriptional regulator, leucine-responsive regulatory protein